jgi:small subunit ribosomal protein S6e
LEFKVIISDGDHTYQKEIRGDEANRLVGLRIGEDFDGSLIGESGTLQVTGGTDKDGFPMRRGIIGPRRTKVLLKGGPGFNPIRAGERRKKRVRGDTISEDIVQINTKVIKKKKKKLEPKKEVEKPKEEKPKPKKEVEKPKEEKPKPKKEVEKPKEEKPKPKKEVEKPKEEKPKEEKPKPKKEVEIPEKKAEIKPEKPEPKKEKPKPKKEKPKEELIPIKKVRGIGKVTAEKLTSAGISSAQDLLVAKTEELAAKTDLSEKQVENLKESAEELMG